MPRAHRQFVAGHVWHITHRCHERSFLLENDEDRSRYLHWLAEARERYGLSVLDYVVTSNHVHLLLRDTAPGVIARSMQLAAGRTAQEFNERVGRRGAFWEDRYHATAVETGVHLCRCIAYIDLNMVRAGAVTDPADWPHSGYAELVARTARHAICDVPTLFPLCGYTTLDAFRRDRRSWVSNPVLDRADYWTQAVAVGSPAFIDQFCKDLGSLRLRRRVTSAPGETTQVLREPAPEYLVPSSPEEDNTVAWA